MSKDYKTYKFRIYPTLAQEKTFIQTLDDCRELYNGSLQEKITYYQKYNKTLSYYDQKKELVELKNVVPCYKNIYSQVLADVIGRLDQSYEHFFRRLKTDEKPGFPKLKNKNDYNSFTYPQGGFELDTAKNKLWLSKIGDIKIKLHRNIDGEIKNCIIVRKATGKWYICFGVKIAHEPLPKTNNIIGIDLGIKTYITTSDKETIKNPKFINKHLEKLAKKSRKFNKKNTNQNKKSRARAYEKLVNCRKDYQHKTANKIIKENDIIILENLDVLDMLQNRKSAAFNRNINDCAWGRMKEYLIYKSKITEKHVILVDPKNTSKQCSVCKNIKDDLKLEDRVYNCDNCKLVIDRDYNAAINIKDKGLSLKHNPEIRDIISAITSSKKLLDNNKVSTAGITFLYDQVNKSDILNFNTG